ncbi:substrate-binding domain-containing protein [Alkanindiges sp. WGS2144]|uniref:substrate-binding domain-containing protein n=1 Tax=Alkanindiges sp. WGS2144 TaxID=3366808 RepID=UPI0037536018
MRLYASKLTLALLTVSGLGIAVQAQAARNTVQIAGSSTVLPFASIVAEEFGNTYPQYKAPVVASGGSSGGFRQFCQGIGDNTIDIANASRPIKSAEIEACKKAGVSQIHEVKFGYDGIVFASRSDKPAFKLKPQHVYSALAAQVPSKDNKLMPNPYTRWSQIDKSLPNQEIILIIPASNHGTREVFEEKVVHPGCNAYTYNKKLSEGDNKKACSTFRKDGRVIEISGDYTETLARLQSSPNAVGVFGLSFYEQNRDRLRVATVNGVVPSEATITSGKYSVSRPLYFYVKGQHLNRISGLTQYVEYFLNDKVSGAGSQLQNAGLIPLPKAERAKALASFKSRQKVK